MTEPPHKRARRPDSKQMWEDADRLAPLPSRESDDRRRDDRDRDWKRRYRSRSPRDSKSGRDRDWKRDDRERNGKRDNDRDRERARDKDGGRDKPRQRSRERERERERGRNSGKRLTRSRSPRRDREHEREGTREGGKEAKQNTEKQNGKVLPPEEESAKSRTSTPPVSFKVGAPHAQDHDRMDVDSGNKSNKKGKKKAVEEREEEDDDEIIVEDDGMAAMQAMMGFGGFGTTQNKKVAGNDISAVRKEKRTEYRQYMNRVGGFNRPLSPTRE